MASRGSTRWAQSFTESGEKTSKCIQREARVNATQGQAGMHAFDLVPANALFER